MFSSIYIGKLNKVKSKSILENFSSTINETKRKKKGRSKEREAIATAGGNLGHCTL